MGCTYEEIGRGRLAGLSRKKRNGGGSRGLVQRRRRRENGGGLRRKGEGRVSSISTAKFGIPLDSRSRRNPGMCALPGKDQIVMDKRGHLGEKAMPTAEGATR